MGKVYIYTHDPMLTLLYTKEECTDMFGVDFFDDEHTDIPNELESEFINTYNKLLKISKQLSDIKKKRK